MGLVTVWNSPRALWCRNTSHDTKPGSNEENHAKPGSSEEDHAHSEQLQVPPASSLRKCSTRGNESTWTEQLSTPHRSEVLTSDAVEGTPAQTMPDRSPPEFLEQLFQQT